MLRFHSGTHVRTQTVAKDVLLLLLSAAVLLGCDGPRTAWSKESRSPDGKLIATGFAEEASGIGTGNPGTFVYLNSTAGSQSPTPILTLLPRQSGTIKVGMSWLTADHLELTYN